MSYSSEELSPLVQKRLFHFLNRARTAKAISKIDFAKSSEPGKSDYGIGETVAQRIIDRKFSLPRRRFTELSQLEGIAGFGKEKMQDILDTLQISAAEAFKQDMYTGVLYENFELDYVSMDLEDTSDLEYNRHSSPERLRTILTESLDTWLPTETSTENKAKLVDEIQTCHIDSYSNSAEADTYAWALWFYLFDADNWFTFDQVRLPISRYLGGYFYGDEQSFHLLKGVSNGLFQSGITPKDLPVVVNHDEKTLTVWSGQLFD